MKSDDMLQKWNSGRLVLSTIEDALAEVEVVLFFFSAHWCAPCREFSPTLKEAYADYKRRGGQKVEVVFVSKDANEDAMSNYMTDDHGEWYAVAYRSELAAKLDRDHHIDGLPSLVAVNKDGSVKNRNARKDVQENKNYLQEICGNEPMIYNV